MTNLSDQQKSDLDAELAALVAMQHANDHTQYV